MSQLLKHWSFFFLLIKSNHYFFSVSATHSFVIHPSDSRSALLDLIRE